MYQKSDSNMTRDSQCWGNYLGTLQISQVSHLIWRLDTYMKSTGALSSNELQRLDSKTGHQDSSSSNDYYCMEVSPLGFNQQQLNWGNGLMKSGSGFVTYTNDNKKMWCITVSCKKGEREYLYIDLNYSNLSLGINLIGKQIYGFVQDCSIYC